MEAVTRYYLKVGGYIHPRTFEESHAKELGFKALGFFNMYQGLLPAHAEELIEKWNAGSNERYQYSLTRPKG